MKRAVRDRDAASVIIPATAHARSRIKRRPEVAMEVSCQFSLYPLGVEHLGPGIAAALSALRERGLTVEAGPMSSLVSGPVDAVFAGLAEAFAAVEGRLVLVATVSNACPVG
jgi:uncharacterized protein YqgV (UPF0045/DUF77 family)